jgi:transposase-like protein
MKISLRVDKNGIKKKSGAAASRKIFQIPCPECKAKNEVQVKDIAEQVRIVCAVCKKTVQLSDKDGSFKKLITGTS